MGELQQKNRVVTRKPNGKESQEAVIAEHSFSESDKAYENYE